MVLDKDATTFNAALKAVYNEYDYFDIYLDILSLNTVSTTTSSSSQEGKVADVAISNNTQQQGFCNNCNLPRHFRAKECTQMCSLCPGLAPHKYYQPDVCRKDITMKAQKRKDGTWVAPKRAHNASNVKPSSVDP